jgi:hypothetical protein
LGGGCFWDRTLIPYHVKISIEGLPHHAWFQRVADKVLCDAAIIHHVEESTRRKTYLRAFHCWAFNKYPSMIPQTVYLSLTQYDITVLTKDD